MYFELKAHSFLLGTISPISTVDDAFRGECSFVFRSCRAPVMHMPQYNRYHKWPLLFLSCQICEARPQLVDSTFIEFALGFGVRDPHQLALSHCSSLTAFHYFSCPDWRLGRQFRNAAHGRARMSSEAVVDAKTAAAPPISR